MGSLGTTAEMWQPQVQGLSERVRPIPVDPRGHGGCPVPDGPYAIEQLGGDAALVRAAGSAEVVADAVIDAWFTRPWADANPDLIAHYRAMVAGTPVEGYAGCCEAIAQVDLRGDLARIEAPTLVIAGANDTAAPPEYGREIAAGILGARYELLDPAAHLASVERAGEVGELIAAHVGRSAT
jgi:pimeloyl-ACP methyl ester carboxylesterase